MVRSNLKLFIENSAMGKKSSRKKETLELETILGPVVQMRKEVEVHLLNMARTHKMMSPCPCIGCFSDIAHDFIHEKCDEPFAGVLHEAMMNQISEQWGFAVAITALCEEHSFVARRALRSNTFWD